MYSIQHYAIEKDCQWLVTGQLFSPATPVSSTNKTDLHDISEVVESGVKHHNPTPIYMLTWS
jgi:hypothetical protein